MLLDWVLLLVGLVGAIVVVANAHRLAERPRRGTEWRPSYPTYLVGAAALLVLAIGALLNLLGA